MSKNLGFFKFMLSWVGRYPPEVGIGKDKQPIAMHQMRIFFVQYFFRNFQSEFLHWNYRSFEIFVRQHFQIFFFHFTFALHLKLFDIHALLNHIHETKSGFVQGWQPCQSDLCHSCNWWTSDLENWRKFIFLRKNSNWKP